MRTFPKGTCLWAVGASAILLSGLTGPALALDTNLFTFNSSNSWKQDTLVLSIGGKNVYTGRYTGSLQTTIGGNTTSISTTLFCTDFNHSISSAGQTYNTLVLLGAVTAPSDSAKKVQVSANPNKYQYFYTDGLAGGGLTSAMSTKYDYDVAAAVGVDTYQRRSEEVAYLTEKYLNANLTNTQYAGVQLAIWKIVEDGYTGNTVNLSKIDGKTVSASGNNASYNAAVSFATSVIKEAFNATTSDYNATISQWIQSGSTSATGPGYAYRDSHYQDFVYTIGDATIPEPALYQATALVALGGFGLLRIRRRKSAA